VATLKKTSKEDGNKAQSPVEEDLEKDMKKMDEENRRWRTVKNLQRKNLLLKIFELIIEWKMKKENMIVDPFKGEGIDELHTPRESTPESGEIAGVSEAHHSFEQILEELKSAVVVLRYWYGDAYVAEVVCQMDELSDEAVEWTRKQREREATLMKKINEPKPKEEINKEKIIDEEELDENLGDNNEKDEFFYDDLANLHVFGVDSYLEEVEEEEYEDKDIVLDKEIEKEEKRMEEEVWDEFNDVIEMESCESKDELVEEQEEDETNNNTQLISTHCENFIDQNEEVDLDNNNLNVITEESEYEVGEDEYPGQDKFKLSLLLE
jgi:hypothetical protein